MLSSLGDLSEGTVPLRFIFLLILATIVEIHNAIYDVLKSLLIHVCKYVCKCDELLLVLIIIYWSYSKLRIFNILKGQCSRVCTPCCILWDTWVNSWHTGGHLTYLYGHYDLFSTFLFSSTPMSTTFQWKMTQIQMTHFLYY